MLRLPVIVICVISLAGCSTPLAGSATPPTATPQPTPAPTHTQPAARPTVAPTPVPHPDKRFLSFVESLCGNLASGNSIGVTSVLMRYEYNSGLRWGMMGDGEGHTDDPSLMGTWLATARPHCLAFSTGTDGHGAVLTSGWSQPSGWSIIEADVVGGTWKINDFTFGSQQQLAQAMQVVAPTMAFHG